jgi:addiction module RelE/StbE family toxin
MIVEIRLTKKAVKDLEIVPNQIQNKFKFWVQHVKSFGLLETRKIKGYHDEPLYERWEGCRSVRLNDKYRAIYQLINNNIKLIQIERITPHEYKK